MANETDIFKNVVWRREPSTTQQLRHPSWLELRVWFNYSSLLLNRQLFFINQSYHIYTLSRRKRSDFISNPRNHVWEDGIANHSTSVLLSSCFPGLSSMIILLIRTSARHTQSQFLWCNTFFMRQESVSIQLYRHLS